MKEGLGKLQMKQLTKIIENTLEKMYFQVDKIIRNSQDQLHKDIPC